MKYYKITENNLIYDVREYADGTKEQFKSGSYHREDGPAVEFSDGFNQYWYNNKRLFSIHSDHEFKRYVKLLSIS